MLIGDVEIPRYRVDITNSIGYKLCYYGDSYSEALASVNTEFNKLVDDNYQYPAEVIMLDNYKDDIVAIRHYPDDMV